MLWALCQDRSLVRDGGGLPHRQLWRHAPLSQSTGQPSRSCEAQAENLDFTWCGPRAETQGAQCSVTNMSTYNKTLRRAGRTLQEVHRKNGLICTIQQQTYSGLKSLCQKKAYANRAGGNENRPWADMGKAKEVISRERKPQSRRWLTHGFHLRCPSIATCSDVQIGKCVLLPRTWPAIWLGFKGNSSCWEPAVAPWSQHRWYLGWEHGAPGAPLKCHHGPHSAQSSWSESWTLPSAGGSRGSTDVCLPHPLLENRSFPPTASKNRSIL